MINAYYNLVKPRLLLMNVLVAAAAFIFGSDPTIEWGRLFIMMSGLAFVIGSAAVFNNYADRHLDKKMSRTKDRGLATGQIEPTDALIFGGILLCFGVTLLKVVSPLALMAAMAGFALYVFAYTLLKPKNAYALYVGALAGATPPLVGYAAATQNLDVYAWALFAILFFWQVPHFLAIARYRYDDYLAGGVPLLVDKPKNEEERMQARKTFYLSLVVLLVLCLGLILQRWIR